MNYELCAEYWYQELLTARNEYERRLYQKQLRPCIELIGLDKWRPIRDRIRNNVKRGRIQKVWYLNEKAA